MSRHRLRRATGGGTLMALLAVVLTVVPAPVTASAARADGSGTWTVDSPAGSGIRAKVRLDPDTGTPALSVSRHGRTVLTPAPVGLTTADADLTRGLRPAGDPATRVVHERYTMTTGKRLRRAALMTETRLPFAAEDGTRLDLLVRAAADGVAYRYVLPAPGGSTVTGEASSFSPPGDATAWLQPYNAQHERRRVETTAAAAETGEYGNPALFRTGADYALLTESDVDGSYSGARLYHEQGSGAYRVRLADAEVSAPGPLETPWRTAIVGDLATVTESTLVDDLADPARIGDTSWVRPGKVAWSWLSEHSSPASFERQRDYVDFAARNGWPYVLVDEGWSEEWVPELTRYARAKGVDVLLWFHWTSLDTEAERATILPRIKNWGVRGVKVDFMESDSQDRYRWYDTILAATARHRLMINFHGSTIPHGLARTWPHVMTMEAVHGQEQLPQPDDNPVHSFARNVVGSMDFTPVALEVGPRTSSVAHEAALAIVYESGWQHFADMPEAYERHPGVLRLLNQVPTAWQETRLVGGRPGDEAILARRHGDRWFLGAIAAGEARTLRAPLDFLGGGRWLVELVRDAEGAPRADVRRERSVAGPAETLAVHVPRNGGFAAIVCRARPGRQTCDEPLRLAPETSLTVSPEDAGDTPPGTSFDVTAEFTMEDDRTARDVQLRPRVPDGWTVDGPAVTAPRLERGQRLTGRWRVTVGPQAAKGPAELVVAAEFHDPAMDPDRARMHVAKAVRAFVPPPVPTGTAYVSDLPFQREVNGYGPVERDTSNGEFAKGDGNPITIAGTTYAKGLGTHAPSEVSVYLGRQCESFAALAGLDDETGSPGSVSFQVLGDDGDVRFDSGVVRGGEDAVEVSVDTTGVRMLTLRVTDGGDGKNFDHADWARARVRCG
ncbi:glycoside hydrolase family 97 catalytic domain-containing protein [Qaidamihabitans albus]|uniref:glycoside hydrolase family 97 catalytic domain-containing protein n=1 Tax=Qaidamihabitans albus TaxID=2795733 RepID=UPI0018F237E6|nr:glycoside hydrolase family 97 catalytic domain-containing protein [Qaidamihabitans albus]